MTQSDLVEQLKTPFRFLFDNYGYAEIASKLYDNSENWVVVLESATCGRFLVLHDRGEIIVALGPAQTQLWTDGPWFDLGVIAEYLSQGQDMLAATRGDLRGQLDTWAAALEPYMEEIRQLFSPAVFEDAQRDLDRIGERREEELRQQRGGSNGHRPPADGRYDL